jgi:hypothetical protein
VCVYIKIHGYIHHIFINIWIHSSYTYKHMDTFITTIHIYTQNICRYIYPYIYKYIHIYIGRKYMDTYIHIHKNIFIYVGSGGRQSTCRLMIQSANTLDTQTHKHTHKHTHTHTHTHTNSPTNRQRWGRYATCR